MTCEYVFRLKIYVIHKYTNYINRSSHERYSVKKLFLEISQNPQENTCARDSFLIKLQAAGATLLKKRLWHRCFSMNFAKFSRKTFFIEHIWWLLLYKIFREFVNIEKDTPLYLLFESKLFLESNENNMLVRKVY